MRGTTESNFETTTMLRSGIQMRGYRLLAADGSIGEIEDSYFDDESWRVRYFVVNTGSWLRRQRVLVSPICCGFPDWNRSNVPVDLTKDQVRRSPKADLERPVSRQYEAELHAFYGWPWSPSDEAPIPNSKLPGDPHLRSMNAVLGHTVVASDGEAGRVEDFILDAHTWLVRYVAVETRQELPGHKVLVEPNRILAIRWPEKSVNVALTRCAIRECPGFDPGEPVNYTDAGRLSDYYGRPADHQRPWS